MPLLSLKKLSPATSRSHQFEGKTEKPHKPSNPHLHKPKSQQTYKPTSQRNWIGIVLVVVTQLYNIIGYVWLLVHCSVSNARVESAKKRIINATVVIFGVCNSVSVSTIGGRGCEWGFYARPSATIL